MSTALGIVKYYFPKVKKVNDADEPITIEVTKRDTSSAKRRNHTVCAMAVACKRMMKVDGVIIAVKTAYLIKDDVATRYKLPESVSREVISFDRDAPFDEGTYRLIPAAKSSRLGARIDHGGNGERKNKKPIFKHVTNGVRAALGSKVAPDGITRTHA